MEHLTRRQALTMTGTAIAGLAGCIGEDGSPGEKETTTTRTTSTATTTQSPETTTETAEEIDWTRDVRVISGPRVVDGMLLVGDAAGFLHAMDETGTDEWQLEIGPPIQSLLHTEETIFLTTGKWSGPHLTEPSVLAVEPDGSQIRWSVPIEEGSSWPNLLGVANGVLGVGVQNDYLQPKDEATFGLDIANGSELWRVETGDVTEGAAGPKTIYAADVAAVRAFEATDGTERWTKSEDYADAPLLLDGLPVLAGDSLVAVDPKTGDERWTYGKSLDLAGAIHIGDRLYTRGSVVAPVGPDGSADWEYEKGGVIHSHADGLLFGDDGSTLFALSMDGSEVWTAPIPAEYFSLDAATPDLAAGHWEGTIAVYNTMDGSEAFSFDVPSEHATGLVAIGDHLVVTDDSGIYGFRG